MFYAVARQSVGCSKCLRMLLCGCYGVVAVFFFLYGRKRLSVIFYTVNVPSSMCICGIFPAVYGPQGENGAHTHL